MLQCSNVIIVSTKDNRGWYKASRGKSELHRAECWVTPSESNLRESATEMCTADIKSVRVERCGKSAPAVG